MLEKKVGKTTDQGLKCGSVLDFVVGQIQRDQIGAGRSNSVKASRDAVVSKLKLQNQGLKRREMSPCAETAGQGGGE